jgi:hypothetical protein
LGEHTDRRPDTLCGGGVALGGSPGESGEHRCLATLRRHEIWEAGEQAVVLVVSAVEPMSVGLIGEDHSPLLCVPSLAARSPYVGMPMLL